MTHVDLSQASIAAGGSLNLGGYLATPEGPGPFPAVVMIHEAFGLNDQMRRHADRLAANDGFDAASVNYGRLPAIWAQRCRVLARWWQTTAGRTGRCRAPPPGSKPRWIPSASSTTSSSSPAPAIPS